MMFTGISVSKSSRFGTRPGPRYIQRRKRSRSSNSNTPVFERKDLAVFAVQNVSHLIPTNTVKMRDGKKELPEHYLSANICCNYGAEKAGMGKKTTTSVPI